MNKGIGFLIVVLLILLAIFGGWKLLANFQYKKGLQAYEEFSFAAARTKFDKVANYPGFIGKNVVRAQIKGTEIRAYANLLILEEEKNFKKLAEAALDFLETYPDSRVYLYVEQIFRVNQFNLAQFCLEAGEFEEMETVLREIQTDDVFLPEQQAYAVQVLAESYQEYLENLNSEDYPLKIEIAQQGLDCSRQAENEEYTEDFIRMTEAYYRNWLESFEWKDENWPLVEETWQVFEKWLDENDAEMKNSFGSDLSEEFLVWAQKSERRSDPGLALIQYQFLKNLPGTAPEGISVKILELTVKQGNYHLSKGNTDEALSAYFTLMDDYLSEEEIFALENVLSPDALSQLYELGLARSVSIQQTASILRSISLVDGSQEDDFKAAVRIDLGQAYLESGKFLEAVNSLLEADELAVSREVSQEIDETLSEVVYQVSLLENDLGEFIQKTAGENLSRRAYGGITFPYCNYHETLCLTEDQYDVLKNSIGLNIIEKKIAYSSDYSLEGLNASSPSEAYYYVSRTVNTTRLQTCTYVTTGTYKMTRELHREREDVIVSVFNLKTGYLLFSKTFPGETPSACPAEFYFSSPSETWTGDQVESSTVKDWLSSVCVP